MTAHSCAHETVSCLNQHELIRKYRCQSCGAVMMCECDQPFGIRFLAHQLREGTELETQARVPVTEGFVSKMCSECRGLPADPAPAGEIFGRTTKIKRYYWREIFFAERAAQADWHDANPDASIAEQQKVFREIERRVLDDIKRLHADTPKYTFNELSQAQVIEHYAVEVEALSATYVKDGGKGAQIWLDGAVVSPETFAARHYEALDWSVLPLESGPFHALFGVMMFLLIQDPRDPLNRMVSFGDRTSYEERREGKQIWTHLPDDFGTKGYARRRSKAVNEHFKLLHPDGAAWQFDYWKHDSEDLRQYLWAHRSRDVERAQKLVEILPHSTLVAILRYLVDDYWRHYLGWPDLLLYRDEAFMFVEVKSSSDKLSEDQKRWIADNHDTLQLPFRLAKIHRAGTL